EMLQELGFCSGIENYSRVMEGRAPGTHPFTLLDYFASDFVVFVDESHQTVPQIGGMYEGDRSRKQTLVEYGFRLPSALDNRPLRFDEFLRKVPQLVFVSATPGPFELRHSNVVAEQLIRPTFLVDPEVELRETRNHIDDLLNEIRRREEAGERVLVTTLRKKLADELTEAIKGPLDETNGRRAKQLAYNEEHGITPESIVKGVSDIAEFLALEQPQVPSKRRRGAAKVEGMSREDLEKLVSELEEEMFAAAEELRFEYAAKLRDEIKEIRRELVALAAV